MGVHGSSFGVGEGAVILKTFEFTMCTVYVVVYRMVRLIPAPSSDGK